jgi:hypothetical protein
MVSSKASPSPGREPRDLEEVRGRPGDAHGLTEEERRTLLDLAWASIRAGIRTGGPLDPELDEVPPGLRGPGAVFVTLKLHGQLRGCIGSFEARRPLALDVAQNAFSAAFMDFRFPPVTEAEVGKLDLHISLLTPLEPLEVADREELICCLRPGMDGLLLEDTPHRATFLPQVWESLASPEEFLGELLLKAGLPSDHWSLTLRFYRYGVVEI